MNDNNNLSPMGALLLLLGVIAIFFGIKYYTLIENNWPIIISSLTASQNFLFYTITSMVINVFLVSVLLERIFGYKKQGSRLRRLTDKKLIGRNVLLNFTFSFLSAFLIKDNIYEFSLSNGQYLLNIFPSDIYLIIIGVSSKSLIMLCCIGIFIISALILKASELVKFGNGLSRFSTLDNHLTLGSIGEEENCFDNIESPKWVTIPKKGLTGNILITGSIGSGKTQGTILPYVEQLFNQFSPSPSALVLDPKGSLIREVIKVLKKNKLTNNCVYLGDIDADI